jgi:tetratricopeptide (TPR) repeat protein
LSELKRAVELAPNDPDAFYYLGRLYFTSNNAPAALSAYQKSIQLDPSSVRAYNHLGQTYEAMGRTADAEHAYLKAIEIDQRQAKKSEWPYYNLGLLYFNRGRAKQSITWFRDAIARNPQFVEAKMKLAAVLATHEPADEALKLLEEAVQAEPQNAEAHYRLALLLSKSGNREEAQQHFALFEKYRKP